MSDPVIQIVPVDTDVPPSAMPEAEEGIKLITGEFLEYDQTMEVFRTMETILDRCFKEPSLLGKEEARPPEQLTNHEWLACYLWAVTLPSRKAQSLLADVTPIELAGKVRRSDATRVQREMILFLREMNPTPKSLGISLDE